MSKRSAKETPTVGAVANAVALLRTLVALPAPAGVNALARAAGVSPSSSFNILKTLATEALVDFDPTAKTYSPGAGLFALAMQGANERGSFARCASLLEHFAQVHGATVTLWRMTPFEKLVLVGIAESKSATRIQMTLGYRLPLLVGAGGRCMAARLGLSKDTITERFKQLRWDNPPTLQTYLREVQQAKKRGWAVDMGNVFAGISTVSVPILDRHERSVFVVNVSFFLVQRTKAELAEVGEELKLLAPRVASALGLVH